MLAKLIMLSCWYIVVGVELLMYILLLVWCYTTSNDRLVYIKLMKYLLIAGTLNVCTSLNADGFEYVATGLKH